MKKDVLNRYERTSDGRVLIDVAAASVEDFYNDFDKNAPYIRRDLDQDLVEYLIDCARELGHEPFAIRFTLDKKTDEKVHSRVRRSLNVYFQYLAEIERQKTHRMLRRSSILLCAGLAILFVSVWVNQVIISEASVWGNVFAQGLTVAAWVSLWESLATFLIEWFPHRKDIKLYRRLSHAQLVFREEPANSADPL